MIYIAAAVAVYLTLMLAVSSFSMTAGIVLLCIGLIAGGAAAASLAG